jgi:hypothetical protein
MILDKYHTVRTGPKSNRKIPHCQNRSKIVKKNTTLSEQVQNCKEKYHTVRTGPNCIKKYHTVRTGPKLHRKIPHCQNRSKIV